MGYIYREQRELLDSFIAILGLGIANVWSVTLNQSNELAFLLMVRANFTGDMTPIEAVFDSYCGKGALKKFAKISDMDAQYAFLNQIMSGNRTQREVMKAIATKKPMLDKLLAELAKQLPRHH